MHRSPRQSTSLRQINRQCKNSSRHLHQRATQSISLQRQPHHPCSNSPSQILARPSLQDLELVEGGEDVDTASVQTRDAKGVCYLLILLVAVARVAYPPIGGGCGGGVVPFTQQNARRNAAPMFFNRIKRYANWNVCFSCGFDVEDGHTSKTCPAHWRRTNHQEEYTHANSGQYIAAIYDACTKAMHKSQLPTM